MNSLVAADIAAPACFIRLHHQKACST